jgi:hypothetical protein
MAVRIWGNLFTLELCVINCLKFFLLLKYLEMLLLLIYGLFYRVVCIPDCMMSNDKMVSNEL